MLTTWRGRSLDTRMALWETRLGRQAVEDLQHGLWMNAIATLPIAAWVVAFVVSMLVRFPVGAAVSTVLLIVAAGMYIRGMHYRSKAARAVVHRYQLKPSARWTMPYRRPAQFDKWLQAQRNAQ